MSDQLSLASLESLYTFDPDVIGPFLHAHPFLVPLLEEAHAHLREFFPDNPLALAMNDPFDDAVRLWLLIDTDQPDARQTLRSLDEEWWIPNAARGQHLLSIDIERT